MRVITKIGDVFEIQINGNSKKYFQYIANDLTQLNSDVIRGFIKEYTLDAQPKISEIVNGNVAFYAHCAVSLGIKLDVWKKVGKSIQLGEIHNILFRGTNDYGSKQGEEPVRVSRNWYVWRINDANFTSVGKLEGEFRNSFIGIVMNPYGIVELLKGKKHPPFYPDFE